MDNLKYQRDIMEQMKEEMNLSMNQMNNKGNNIKKGGKQSVARVKRKKYI